MLTGFSKLQRLTGRLIIAACGGQSFANLVLQMAQSQTGNAIEVNSPTGTGGDKFKVDASGNITNAANINVGGNLLFSTNSISVLSGPTLWLGTGGKGFAYDVFGQTLVDSAGDQYFSRNGFLYCQVTVLGINLMFPLVSKTTSSVPLTLKLFASQTADAFQINSNSGSGGDILRISKGGIFELGATDAASVGPIQAVFGNSSTSTRRQMSDFTFTWSTSTDATRKGRLIGNIWDTAARQWIQVDTDGTNPTIAFSGLTTCKHLGGSGTAPTIAVGTGAGTSPTIALTGTDLTGQITLTTGTLPTGSATVFTVTFNTAFSAAPNVIFCPANANTASLSGLTMVYVTSTITTFVFTVGATGLAAATQYVWNYATLT